MHPCIYHTASCKRKTAPANKNSQKEMENNPADGRAATTKQDLKAKKKRTKLVLAATY